MVLTGQSPDEIELLDSSRPVATRRATGAPKASVAAFWMSSCVSMRTVS